MRRPLLGFLDYTPPAALDQFYAEEILLREPNLWTPGKKPIGPVTIDWSHPLTNGLQSFLVFNGSQPLFDLVTLSNATSQPVKV